MKNEFHLGEHLLTYGFSYLLLLVFIGFIFLIVLQEDTTDFCEYHNMSLRTYASGFQRFCVETISCVTDKLGNEECEYKQYKLPDDWRDYKND